MRAAGQPARAADAERITAAVERALDERHRDASNEVERILAAAIRVMERMTPQAPRVDDIVTEAGSSKKAFYKYFAGKDDLQALMVGAGWAWAYTAFSDQYVDAERRAAARGVGVHAHHCQPPWEWRALKRAQR